MAVCMVFAGVIGYYIASMLLVKSFKVFRGSGIGALGTIIASAVLCCVIAADPFGVESWIPDVESLEEVEVSLHGNYGGSVSATLSNPADIQKLLETHQAILAEENSLNLRESGSYNEDEMTWMQINLFYYLKDGREVYRYYTIFDTVEHAAQSDAVSKIAALASDPAVQEGNIFGRFIETENRTVRLTGGYMWPLYSQEGNTEASVNLTHEQAQALEDAIRRDIQAGHFGRTIFLTSASEYANSVYRSELELYYSITEHYEDGSGSYSEQTSIRISTYCTETIQTLRDIGVLTDSQRMVTRAEYREMQQETGDSDYTYYDDVTPLM